MAQRQDRLLNPGRRRAVETGLAPAEWHHSGVPRSVMQRRDGPAPRETAVWPRLMAALAGGVIAIRVQGHPRLSLPLSAAYGVVYGSGEDSRRRETQHGPAFRRP